jgi:hypothetical protein
MPAQPLELWHKYKAFICDNLQCQLARLGIENAASQDMEDYGLYLIQSTLLWEGNKTMKDVGMCSPAWDWHAILNNCMLQDQSQYVPLGGVSPFHFE